MKPPLIGVDNFAGTLIRALNRVSVKGSAGERVEIAN
jgi:hypothetical protein